MFAALFLFAASPRPIVDPTPRPPGIPIVRAWQVLPPRKPQTPCDHDATVLHAVSPAYPDVARNLGLGTVMAVVEVSIDARGRAQRVAVYKSAGYVAIDRAAVGVARASTYAPAKKRCRAVPGTYLYRVEFSD